MKSSILLLDTEEQIFTLELLKNLKDTIDIDLLYFHDGIFYSAVSKTIKKNHLYISFFKKSTIGFIGKFFLLLKIIFAYFFVQAKGYKVVNIHYCLGYYYYFFNYMIFKPKIVITIYGSDYYCLEENRRKKMKKIFSIAHRINFTNAKTMEEVNHYYNYSFQNKMQVVPFGISLLEVIDKKRYEKAIIKKKWNIPEDSLVITCGSNGREAQNHEKMIEAIESNYAQFNRNIYMILPLTYLANKERINTIREKLCKSMMKHSFVIIDSFLSSEEIAELRIVSDVMINVQNTDQFSAAMQEYIYADNLVITGAWLPYDVFLDSGVCMKLIRSFDDLPQTILDTINNFDNYEINYSLHRKVIWGFSSWEVNKNQWRNLLAFSPTS